jgi:hypothetical protein
MEKEFNVPVYFFKSLEYQMNKDFDPETIDEHLEDLVISFRCENLKTGEKITKSVLYTGNEETIPEVEDAVNLNGVDLGGLCIEQNVEKTDCIRVMNEIEESGLPRSIISSEMIKNVIKTENIAKNL